MYLKKFILTGIALLNFSLVEGSVLNQSENLNLGNKYFKDKNWEKALEYYKKAYQPETDINSNPYNEKALDGIINVLDIKGDYLEEIRALEIFLQSKPNIPKYRTKLAEAYVKQGSSEKAIENFKAALKVAPKYEKAYMGLLNFYEQQKNYDEAAEVLKNIVSNVGDKQNKWISKLCAYKTLQNYYEDAKLTCQEAIARAPQVAENHVYLGISYKFTENEQQGQKILISAANKFKSSELAQYYGGQASDEIKNWEQSVKFYRQGSRTKSDSARCFLGLAKAQFELRKYGDSLQSFLKACEMDNTVDQEIKMYAGQLRAKNVNDWYLKFRNDVDKCSVLRSARESKKTLK